MTIEQAIEHAEQVANSYNDTVPECECAKEHRQLAAWLRELQECRKEPEIIRCDECEYYVAISSGWGKCAVHSSPTEKYRTCQRCDYCSWAEKKEDKRQYIKNKLSTL